MARKMKRIPGDSSGRCGRGSSEGRGARNRNYAIILRRGGIILFLAPIEWATQGEAAANAHDMVLTKALQNRAPTDWETINYRVTRRELARAGERARAQVSRGRGEAAQAVGAAAWQLVISSGRFSANHADLIDTSRRRPSRYNIGQPSLAG